MSPGIAARTVDPEDLSAVAAHFRLEGSYIEGAPYGHGHINDTFAIRQGLPSGVTRRYILQRVNTYVFHDPVGLMNNISSVTRHLKEEVVREGGDPERETLNLVHEKDGAVYFVADGSFRTAAGFWRAYLFIEGATTYDMVRTPEDMRSAAQAFGTFQRRLRGFPVESLTETIPDFHDTRRRVQALKDSVNRDPLHRAEEVESEIEFAYAREEPAGLIIDGLRSGRLPGRVTHNDTKINNVMIDDASGKGICVIDLDTVMMGSSLFDFGDAIRFGANTASEDEIDSSLVTISLEHFRSFVEGYLEATADIVTPYEVELLVFSARLMTYECGVRFLADFLDGDRYFKTHRAGHNLDRARNQFRLVEEMERQANEMERIVHKAVLRYTR